MSSHQLEIFNGDTQVRSVVAPNFICSQERDRQTLGGSESDNLYNFHHWCVLINANLILPMSQSKHHSITPQERPSFWVESNKLLHASCTAPKEGVECVCVNPFTRTTYPNLCHNFPRKLMGNFWSQFEAEIKTGLGMLNALCSHHLMIKWGCLASSASSLILLHTPQ